MTFLLLIFGFILIEMPIVAFLSVVNDVHQPLPILIMALICTVIDVFIITNRITFHKANGGNEERMRKIRKAVKITAIIIAVCLLPGTWFVSEEGYKANRKKGSSYDYNYLGSHSSYDSRVFGSSRGESSSSAQHDDTDSDDTSSSDSDRTSYYPTQKPQVNQKITNGVEDSMIRMIMLLIMQKNLHMMNLGMMKVKRHMIMGTRKLMTTGWMREEMMKVIELYCFNQNVIER